MPPATPFTLLFLAGELMLDTQVLELARAASSIVCADSGAEHAYRLKLEIDSIIGDLDSISPKTLEYYRGRCCTILNIAEQGHNDFEKVLLSLMNPAGTEVVVLGMTGGRLDHTLSNLSVMLRHSDLFKSIVAYDRYARHQFLTSHHGTISFDSPLGTTISLTPFGAADGITTSNLLYPLNTESLRAGMREGLSNVTTGAPATVTITGGALLVSIHSATEQNGA